MFDLPPNALAILTGFVSGLLLSIPPGPINLTIINEGARCGFRWVFFIGLGGVVMEVIYCAFAFTGFTSLFDRGYVKAAMEVFSFAFMLFLGIKLLLARTVEARSLVEERIEKKLHPHSAFMIGLVRVMGNPGVLLFWIVLAANFTSREWVQPTWNSKILCISGVAGGTFLWFLGLSYAVSLGHQKFSPRTLLWMEHISGVSLLLLAFAHGYHLVWEMKH
jgi:threonine/homoserine/homoserine lactone efflux protein